MGLKKLLVIAIALLSIEVAAEKADNENLDKTGNDEVVTKHADIATKLGLTDQDAVFGTPRDFRDGHLNEVSIEPLSEDKKN